ncbi:MAG: hypothetical protein SAK29_28840 [Scytonema sp. PMC 1069.18]|nr:hypothetical protein [Scytonema sp. PMC 1069.18]MEC4886058.1 hypothetical protein [Scytonema sp. PMC 1070.18]
MLFYGKKIRIASAFILLSTSAPLWFVSEAIFPQLVQAYTARVDLSIDRLPGDNYETLLRRAEAAARAATQRNFDQDILVTDVSIYVSVQNYGAIAPVLVLEVSRPQWRTRPDPQLWAKYFKTSRSLLFFGENFKKPTANQPDTDTTPAPESQPDDPKVPPNMTPPAPTQPTN